MIIIETHHSMCTSLYVWLWVSVCVNICMCARPKYAKRKGPRETKGGFTAELLFNHTHPRLDTLSHLFYYGRWSAEHTQRFSCFPFCFFCMSIGDLLYMSVCVCILICECVDVCALVFAIIRMRLLANNLGNT